MRLLVTGPNGSGKSSYAEATALDYRTGPIEYIATLPKMPIYRRKIKEHQSRRGTRWRLTELSGEYSADKAIIQNVLNSDRTVLLDGLNILVRQHIATGNLITSQRILSDHLRSYIEDLVSILCNCSGSWIVVDNSLRCASMSKLMLSEVMYEFHDRITNEGRAEHHLITPLDGIEE